MQPSDIEIVKITIEWGEAIAFLEMTVLVLPESFPEEVADMAKNDQNQVANVGCDQIVVWRILNNGLGEETAGMTAGIPVTLVAKWTKLSMLSSYSARLGS